MSGSGRESPPWLALAVDAVSTDPDAENARSTLGGLVAGIAHVRPAWRIAVIQPNWAADPFDGDRPENIRVGRLAGVPRRGFLRWFYLKSTLPRALRRLDVDLVMALGPVTAEVRPPTILLITGPDELRLPEGTGLIARSRRDRVLGSLGRSALILALTDEAAAAAIALIHEMRSKVRLAPTPDDVVAAIEEITDTRGA